MSERSERTRHRGAFRACGTGRGEVRGMNGRSERIRREDALRGCGADLGEVRA